ncbi:hypothetical protein JOF53_005497 [Crossiella equi]|uniref:Uncharacterized protein n=1 Tax=Crossiella equi TaxID=130796 RepID=A0ABS5AJ78_9PSEU|nr:hypothetical protein [Crossiella equi]MBP2476625.1 hypothetical protein [Crossiella equi]
MAFSPAQFNAVKEKVEQGVSDLEAELAALRALIRTTPVIAGLPDFMREAVEWCAERIYTVGYHLCVVIKDIALGIAAPVMFFLNSLEWGDVRGYASTVVGQLKPEVMPAGGSWSGAAAGAYKSNIKPQGDAANKIATIADKTSGVLMGSAVAGLAFYAGIGAILAKSIAGVVTGALALGSGVFTLPGLALLAGELTLTSGTVWALISALTAFLGAQAVTLASLKGESVDNSFFPGGKWPDPFSGSYGDGSVQDGDADWSLNR